MTACVRDQRFESVHVLFFGWLGWLTGALIKRHAF
jgi:hypothetical protein